jgi:alkylated DNA repair protein (DNA oxidative demethylase)
MVEQEQERAGGTGFQAPCAKCDTNSPGRTALFARNHEPQESTMSTPPAGFRYIPDVLSQAEAEELTKLLEGLTYEHEKVRGRPLKRGYAQFGSAYITVGRKLKPAPPFPDFLSELAAKCLPHCPKEARFNQFIVTVYPPGAAIGWHPDAPCFGECIAAVSLGSAAELLFREDGATEPCYRQLVAPRSLYVMTGPARWDYEHSTMPVKAKRLSVTFRHVAGAEGRKGK